MLRLAVLLCVVACDAGVPTRLVHGKAVVASGIAVVQPDVDALARAELDQFVERRAEFPDSGLLESDPVLVRSDLREPAGPVISARALPSSHFSLQTNAELGATANRAQHGVPFIFIDSIEIDGDTATVWTGVSVARPDEAPPGDCCCSRQDKYTKRGGTWTYAATISSECS